MSARIANAAGNESRHAAGTSKVNTDGMRMLKPNNHLAPILKSNMSIFQCDSLTSTLFSMLGFDQEHIPSRMTTTRILSVHLSNLIVVA
jgi:hypothetical protein